MEEELDIKEIDIKKQYSGTAYQIKVLLLLLCRGKKVQDYEHFYLRTEVKEAEKFDDALFYYKNNGEKVYNVRYCQIKNSESETAELRYSDFVNDFNKAVANIKKYFISYRKIKITSIDENLDDFVLCTSYKLPLELKKNYKSKIDETLLFYEDDACDPLFGHSSGQWKKYKIRQISNELRHKLMKTTDLDLLVEALTDCIIKSKKQKSSVVTIDFENFWLSIYKSALEKENVLEPLTKNKKSRGNKSNNFIFSKQFLEDTVISKECKNFRKIFLNHCGTKLMNSFLRDKQFPADQSFINLLNAKSDKTPLNAVNETEPSLSQNQLKKAEKLSEFIFSEKVLTDEIDIQNVSTNMIFKNDDPGVVMFTTEFVQNERLTFEAKHFREAFLISYAVVELKNMKLKQVQNKCKTEKKMGSQTKKQDLKNITSDEADNYTFQCQSLINKVNVEAEMEEFFERFSIQTMPHHNELMEIIKREIGEEFNLLDDKWVTNSLLQKVEQWFKKAEEVPLDKSEILKFYEKIKKDILTEMIEGNFYLELLKSYNLSFSTISETWKCFLKPNNLEGEDKQHQSNNLLLISTDEPILTAIKLENALLSFDYYKKHKSFIIAPSSVLQQMENKAQYVTNALKSKDCYNSIIIVDDNTVSTFSLFYLFNYHLTKFNKKIILVTTEKKSTYECLKWSYMFQEDDDDFRFDQLTEVSQKYVKERHVLFQGKSVPLNTIISETFNSIDAKTMMQLVSDQMVEICAPLEPYKEYDEKSYIERKIGLFKMNEKFFAKTFSDCLFLVEAKNTEEVYEFLKSKKIDENKISTKQWNSHSPFFAANSENAEIIFQQMSEKNSNFRIYWFYLKNSNLFLFHGTTSAFESGTDTPLSFTEKYYEDEKEAVIFLSKSKTVIITDSPGMGKSTILTSLSQNISDDILNWKIRIDLNKYSKQLMELKEAKQKENENYNDIEKYLIDKLCGRRASNTDEKPFAFCVFDDMFHQNKILFIFDGFDEISPDYESIVLEIFEKIRITSQNHLWITSRLNMRHTLEQKLKTLCFKIMPFTVNDQIEFLTKFWKNNRKETWNRICDHHLKIYAKYLITEFNEMTKRNGTDIIGIPLQTKMLGDVFQENEEEEADNDWQSCYKFIKDTSKCHSQNCCCFPSIQSKLQNLFVLYDCFVKKHIKRHLIEKEEIDNSKVGWSFTEKLHYAEMEKVHSLLGIFAFIADFKLDSLISIEEQETKTFWLQEIKTGNASFGLISHVSEDNKPLFTHLTFAEFFAANFISKKLLLHPFKVFELMDSIMKSDVPVFIYCIKHLIKTKIWQEKLEKALDNTTAINYLTKHGLINCLKYFTMDDSFEKDFPQIDRFGKTPLHFAVEFNHIKCVVFILLYKYNRLSKTNYGRRERLQVNSEDIDIMIEKQMLIEAEKRARLFLLQEFITLPDAKGKNALNYSKNQEITDLLNDFIQVGRNDLKPTNYVRTKLTSIQFTDSEYDFTKILNGKQSNFSMAKIWYSFSLETILAILNNCDLLSNENFLFNDNNININNKNFFNCISGRYDKENRKISFFNTLLVKLPKWKLRMMKHILVSSITQDNFEVFKYFYIKENICLKQDLLKICFKIASEARKHEYVQFLFENSVKSKILDLSDLPLVATDLITLKLIFKQFKGDISMEQKYASKILLHDIKESYPYPSIEKVQYLLSKKANINFKNEYGDTTWDFVLRSNNRDVIKVMVPFIKDLSQKVILQNYFEDKSRINIYINAFKLKNEKLCTFLIRKCPNVNIKDENGKTLLCYACEKGWTLVTKRLLKFGACYEDVFDENGDFFPYYQTNNEIQTLLNNSKMFFTALLKKPKSALQTSELFGSFKDSKVSLHTVNKENKPLWFVAASAGHETNITSIFAKTIYNNRMNFQDLQGNTALHLAAKGGFKKIVEILLESGACYNIKNYKNELPQHLTDNNDIRLIFEYLDYLFQTVKENKMMHGGSFFKATNGSIFNAKDCFGRTLLHYVAINGSYSSFFLVFDKISVFNIDKIDKHEKTPLYYAIKSNAVKIVKTLFQRGAGLKEQIYYERINENQCIHFIRIVNQLFKDIQNNKICAFVNTIKSFYEKPISGFSMYDILNVKNSDGKSLYCQAVELNNYELVKFLMEMGAIVYPYCAKRHADNKIQNLEKFIFEIIGYLESKAFENSSIIRLIEKNKCTMVMTKVRNIKKYDTLLHKAVEADNSEIMEWLLINGVDLSVTNECGETASYIAEKTASDKIIDILTQYENESNMLRRKKNRII